MNFSKIYRARTVIPMNREPIENGAVAISENGENGKIRIRAVGNFREIAAEFANSEVIDLGEMALLPGLINAHCHLDYTMLRGAIPPQQSFRGWVGQINALKSTLKDTDYLRAVSQGFDELKKWGTTAVLNIESFPHLLSLMAKPPIRVWCFHEMIDVREPNPKAASQLANEAESFFAQHADWLGGYGLSPHAPYTVSPKLLRETREVARAKKIPVTIHVAESADEMAMFRDASGPFYEFLSSIGRDMSDCGIRTPLAHVLNFANDNWLLVHLNELDESDFTLLANFANGHPNIAHCPLSHRYFSHRKFPYRRLHELAANICVGTDSLASNDSLNLFAELQALAAAEPWLRPKELLETVTRNPARALKKERLLGEISPGAYADLIALPDSTKLSGIYEKIVHNQRPIPWLMVNGKVIS